MAKVSEGGRRRHGWRRWLAASSLALAVAVLLGYHGGRHAARVEVTPGPDTVSLEPTERGANALARGYLRPSPVGTPLPGGMTWVEGFEDYYAHAPFAKQALFIDGHWVVVATSPTSQSDELVVLDPDWSHPVMVVRPAEAGAQGEGRDIALIPDRAGRRVAVLVLGPKRDAFEVAMLDVAQARLDVLHRIPWTSAMGSPRPLWVGDRLLLSYASAQASMIDEVLPAAHSVRRLFTENPSVGVIQALRPSPDSMRVAFDRVPLFVLLHGEGPPGALGVTVLDLRTGRAAPVARDSRRRYYHGVVAWDDGSTLRFYVLTDGGKADVYRAKLRPAGGRSPS